MSLRLTDLGPVWPSGYPAHRPVSGAVSRDLDRQAEEAYGIPSLVLMEHASLGVAALAARLAGGGPVVVLCGPGNNGGDGYGAARFLASWGATLRVIRCSRRPPSRPDAALEVALARSAAGGVEDAWLEPERIPHALEGAALVVDALFGVGLDRDLDPPYPDWIRAVNEARCTRLAVDVPSGLDADSGEPRPVAVRAHVTATMGMPKTGLRLPGTGALHAGHVVEVDIGLPGPLHLPYRAGATGTA